MTRLLLISCSARKQPEPETLPALLRYDGGIYRIIRKAIREKYWPRDVHIRIISAHYGLIGPLYPTQLYDHKMTIPCATALMPLVSYDLDQLIKREDYQQVFISMSALYRCTLAESRELERLEQAGKVLRVTRGLGIGLQQTKDWLLTDSQFLLAHSIRKDKEQGKETDAKETAPHERIVRQ